MTARVVHLAAGLAVLALAGCEKNIPAPTDRGVCWHVSPREDGTLKFNKVAQNIPDMEHCAAELEKMRLTFLRMGGTNQELAGAYQGNYLFLRQNSVYRAQRYKGAQYLALTRYGDKLVMPGAIPQD